MTLTLFASTDGPDTDFTAVLSDVHPDGFVQNLGEGLCRLRFRERFDDPQAAVADQIYELHLTLGNISHVYRTGHRIRLHVSSSDFPRYDRNLNTGEPQNSGCSGRVAHQTIYHSQRHPSALILPVIPSPQGAPQ